MNLYWCQNDRHDPLKLDLNIKRWYSFRQADINDLISLKYAIYNLFFRFNRHTDMISFQKETDKIFTYDVILRRWRHRNDSLHSEVNSDKLCGHFDTHKGSMKSFHLDFTFWHMTKMSKKWWFTRFHRMATMSIVFVARKNPRTTSSVGYPERLRILRNVSRILSWDPYVNDAYFEMFFSGPQV